MVSRGSRQSWVPTPCRLPAGTPLSLCTVLCIPCHAHHNAQLCGYLDRARTVILTVAHITGSADQTHPVTRPQAHGGPVEYSSTPEASARPPAGTRWSDEKLASWQVYQSGGSFFREWRVVLKEYPASVATAGRAVGPDESRLARRARPHRHASAPRPKPPAATVAPSKPSCLPSCQPGCSCALRTFPARPVGHRSARTSTPIRRWSAR